MSLEHRLDLSRGDVLAAAYDRVRLAPCDAQATALIEAGEIAGVQPPIRRNGARCNGRAAHEDLLIGGDLHARAEQRRSRGG